MKSHSNEQQHATATKLHVYPIQIKNNMLVTTKEKHMNCWDLANYFSARRICIQPALFLLTFKYHYYNTHNNNKDVFGGYMSSVCMGTQPRITCIDCILVKLKSPRHR